MHRLKEQRRSQRWCFTINNYTRADIKAVEEVPCKFLVYGKEVGKQGTPHLQGYVEFAIYRRLSNVHKLLGGRAHCDPSNGTAGENIEYCTKEKNYWMTDKELERNYKFYDDHPLPENWTKQERYEMKLTSNHENWTEEDLKSYIKEREKFAQFLIKQYPHKTRAQIFKTQWDEDEPNKNFHYYQMEDEFDISE